MKFRFHILDLKDEVCFSNNQSDIKTIKMRYINTVMRYLPTAAGIVTVGIGIYAVSQSFKLTQSLQDVRYKDHKIEITMETDVKIPPNAELPEGGATLKQDYAIFFDSPIDVDRDCVKEGIGELESKIGNADSMGPFVLTNQLGEMLFVLPEKYGRQYDIQARMIVKGCMIK